MAYIRPRYVKTDGTIDIVQPANGTDFSLEELQRFVGGYIEIINLNRGQIAVVNEEGIIHGLQQNFLASVAAGRTLVGNVLFCNSNQVR